MVQLTLALRRLLEDELKLTPPILRASYFWTEASARITSPSNRISYFQHLLWSPPLTAPLLGDFQWEQQSRLSAFSASSSWLTAWLVTRKVFVVSYNLRWLDLATYRGLSTAIVCLTLDLQCWLQLTSFDSRQMLDFVSFLLKAV